MAYRLSYDLKAAAINQGALAGRYAIQDLSNTGKFTNIINSIPVRHKLFCTGNSTEKTLTLIEGSTVTILDGHSDTNSDTTLFEYYALGNKYTLHNLPQDTNMVISNTPATEVEDNDPTKFVYIVYNKIQDRLELGTYVTYTGYNFTITYSAEPGVQPTVDVDMNHTGEITVILDGNEFTYPNRPMEYNDNENTWKGPEGQATSIPLGYFDGNWNLHSFSSIGFYGKIFWVDRDVEALIPNGKTDTFGMKVANTSINKIVFTNFDGNGSTGGHQPEISMEKGIIALNEDGSVFAAEDFKTYNIIPASVTEGYVYCSGDNYMYTVTTDEGGTQKTKIKCVKLCDMTISSQLFSSISGENIFQAANLKDIKDDIEELKETCMHLTGHEVISGPKTFSEKTIFGTDDLTDGTPHVVIENGILNLDECNITDNGNLNIAGNLNVIQDADDMNYIDEKAANNLGYDGKAGGINVKADAYVVGIETDSNGVCKFPEARNCMNIVGASNAAEGGIILGRYRKDVNSNGLARANKIYGNREGNLVFSAGALLPGKSNMTIGTVSNKFDKMYANRFEGLATSALWADLAEMYLTDEEYPAGTLLEWGGDAELTIAKNEVNAVISDKPAFLMNAGAEGQPVALAGRVLVRVVDTCQKFDKIYLSSIAGVGSVKPRNPEDRPIARALEEKTTYGEGLVMCAVHFSI